MDNLSGILQSRFDKIKEIKPRKVEPWQDKAVMIANKLDIKLSPRWFKFFKVAYLKEKQGKLEECYSFVSDSGTDHPEQLFYWRWYN